MSFAADQSTIDKLPTLEKWKRENCCITKIAPSSQWVREGMRKGVRAEKGECLFVSVRQSERERERARDVFQRVKIIYSTLSLTHSLLLLPLRTQTHALTFAHTLSHTLARTYIKEWIFKKFRGGGGLSETELIPSCVLSISTSSNNFAPKNLKF